MAPDKTIALGVADIAIGDVFQANRYMPDGTVLTPFAPLPGENFAELVYDSTNALCAFTHGEGFATVSRTTSTGALVFSSGEHIAGLVSPTPSGILATPGGDVVRIRAVHDGLDLGMQLDAFSATGAAVYSITKQPSVFNAPYYAAVSVGWIATGSTNRVAIAGTFANRPWLQILDLP